MEGLKTTVVASLLSLFLGTPAPGGRAAPSLAPPRSSTRTALRPLYRVHVGPYGERAEAAQVCAELNSRHIAAIVLSREKGFVVQVGAFRIPPECPADCRNPRLL